MPCHGFLLDLHSIIESERWFGAFLGQTVVIRLELSHGCGGLTSGKKAVIIVPIDVVECEKCHIYIIPCAFTSAKSAQSRDRSVALQLAKMCRKFSFDSFLKLLRPVHFTGIFITLCRNVGVERDVCVRHLASKVMPQ